MLMTCPICDEDAFDTDAGICRHCSTRGTIREVSLEEALDGLLHNAKLQLATLGPNEFQQVLGLFIDCPFKRGEAKAAHRLFQNNEILCAHIIISENGHEMHSLILSLAESGMRRALAIARRIAKRDHMLLEIIPADDA